MTDAAKTFDDYATLAKARALLKSDAKLAEALSISRQAVWYLRRGQTLPDKSVMVRLADLAGIPAQEALADREAWEGARRRAKIKATTARIVAPKTLDDYIDLAKDRAGLTSDRDLGRRLGFTGSPISFWRTGKAAPADDTMIRLAEVAGVDPVKALIDLKVWTAQGKAVGVYREIAEKLGRIAAGIALVTLAAGASTQPGTGTLEDQSNLLISNGVYYEKSLMRLFNQIVRKLSRFIAAPRDGRHSAIIAPVFTLA